MKNGSKKKSVAREQQQIRMGDELKDRIRTYQGRMQKENPGIPVSFASAARALIEKGLEATR